MSDELIISISVACVIFVLATSAVFLCRKQKKKSSEKRIMNSEINEVNTNMASLSLADNQVASLPCFASSTGANKCSQSHSTSTSGSPNISTGPHYYVAAGPFAFSEPQLGTPGSRDVPHYYVSRGPIAFN